MVDEKAITKSKEKRRKSKKIGLLFSITGLTAIVLIVETYAWFIGTGSVKTSEFTIGVTVSDGLELSLDGENWTSTTLDLSEDAIKGNATGAGVANAYTGNTNAWPGEYGLIPISTNGAVDADAGRLILYGKTSISATKGGFRLISTRIDNYSSGGSGIVAEKDGYIAFDLFIKNGEGPDYIPDYNALDDEGIYLTTDSTVYVDSAGKDLESDYGLANSVRLAFMQVGRVKSDSDVSDITSISCTSDEVTGSETDLKGINTGLCEDVKTTIWEPNDTDHDATLIEYFSDVCKTKTVTPGEGGAAATITYGETACTALTDGTAVDTFVVNSDIISSDQIDIYDGLNGFSIPTGTPKYKLEKSITFTDTDKDTTGADRPEFMFLAPNSVTKLRVYIYLEGQDVDNYDLASLGEEITIKFGFTKDILDMKSKYTE